MPLDYPAARQLLDDALAEVVPLLLTHSAPPVRKDLAEQCDIIFSSKTQAFREVLVGCVLARIQDTDVDVRKPYMNHGVGAYNGRTLDERAVNPFFHDNRIPSSKGPYLSTFRRSVKFDATTRAGLRDGSGFDALLECVAFVESAKSPKLIGFLRYLVYRFLELREAGSVPLTKVQRFSLRQYGDLIDRLLATASGGQFPVFLVVSAFRAISHQFGLHWDISHQGINVADGASGAGGDVTIHAGGKLLMAAEITERPVDRNRVVSTFNTKIGPNGIDDYLFFVTTAPAAVAQEQCQKYFAQGHEVSFVDIAVWMRAMLATIGKAGRERFILELLELLEDAETPQSVRASWNSAVEAVIGLA